jgi:hypothetical protein
MKKKENIVELASPALVFVLTLLLSKDFFRVTSIAQIGLIGALSGLISVFWYYLIRHKSFFLQLLMTSSYVTVVLLIGFFYIREDKPSTKKYNLADLKSKLEGTWISRPVGDADSFLKFSFFSNDSLVALVDDRPFSLIYDITENERIFIYDLNGVLRFDLIIHRIDSDSLIFSDADRFLRFSKN